MSAPRCRTLAAVVVLAVTLGLVGAACSKSGKGPDLAKELNGLPSLTKLTTAPAGLDVSGADGFWESTGSTAEVADVIAAKARPDERASGGTDQYLLYPSGTVWVSELNGKSEVVLYKDNDRAYRRHSGVLLASTGWGTRMGGYSGGGGSNNGGSDTGNGFRGGGSGSGK
ncbi:MAG: DUF4247 domain-containing protein [Microthrixaceae bacterium]|jgi:hypothetical protein|nr:DUF4247 domain-containing protein [Microthrixaceae bacterium]